VRCRRNESCSQRSDELKPEPGGPEMQRGCGGASDGPQARCRRNGEATRHGPIQLGRTDLAVVGDDGGPAHERPKTSERVGAWDRDRAGARSAAGRADRRQGRVVPGDSEAQLLGPSGCGGDGAGGDRTRLGLELARHRGCLPQKSLRISSASCVDRGRPGSYSLSAMSDLDRELRQAVSDSEEQTPGANGEQVPPSGEPSSAPDGGGFVSDREVRRDRAAWSGSASGTNPRRNVGLLAALLVVAGAILALVFTSVDEAAIYSVTIDQLDDEREQLSGRTVRVEGELVKGSLRHRAEPCEYRFTLKKNGETLDVRYPRCIVPDTFRDVPDMDVQVTAEGTLAEGGYFEANQIMAKCPSKYEMQQKASNGEAAPHQQLGVQQDLPPIRD